MSGKGFIAPEPKRACELSGKRRMLPGLANELYALGWSHSGPIEACSVCGGSNVWRDPAGVVRHPWCAA